MGKIRGTHSSPGIYTQVTDLTYAAKSLGITTLGLVGETLKGPAFEPIAISNFNEYRDYFGETSAERFKDSLYPKYELPYIAKSYLKASDQLYVCRVLGLSGYNAGPAFIISAIKDGESHVIAVLRSRGEYKKYANIGDECNPITKYDTLSFYCDEIKLEPYTKLSILMNCEGDITGETETESGFTINTLDYGKFTIVAYKNKVEVGRYPVSLNAGTKDYIYNVLGGVATEGSAALFVEEFYDYLLEELINEGATEISSDITKVNELQINAVTDPVRDVVVTPYNELKRSFVGQTFVCSEAGDLSTGETFNGFGYCETNEFGKIVDDTLKPMEIGYIYSVASYTNLKTGKKGYFYVQVKNNEGEALKVGEITSGATIDTVDAVNVLSFDSFVCLTETEEGAALSTIADMSDYHEQFRCASTPWIVSEIKGDAKDLQVKKLFRFHTITDGNYANEQVKISIANVRPDDGTFDVYIRDYNDSDGNPTILESYRNLTMVPGDSKYIGLQIGTLNGDYVSKSKYVVVEVIENDMTETCVPCGFLGYPVRDYSGYGLVDPTFKYNTIYNEDIKDKKQYFGLSDLTGVDIDMLTYKGKNAYMEDYRFGYTNPFHLDSTLSRAILDDLGSGITVTIDGDPTTSGLTWDAVSPNNVTVEGIAPVIGSEEDMEGTIYENVALRKFTVYPYGGFDGWDVYRKSRTSTDEYKANKYKGTIINGHGQTFSRIQNGTQLNLSGNCITSDYYAFLAGARQFENVEKYVINLFATPGIDYVNEKLLSEDILDMIENTRKDSIYVMTTPDKPWGATDNVDNMYSSKEVSENLEDTAIDTPYACTYYPWVKYFDADNNIYINLPATKDVLRNMANVDNKKYPWYAPAGMERGDVECYKMHFFAKLEDEDNVYDGRINPLKTFAKDGVKVWGNKTMLSMDTPRNRVNTMRLMLYLRKIIIESTIGLIFEPNDTTLKNEFESIVRPILNQIKTDRGITDYKLNVSQTPEEMDAHELSAKLWVKPTPTLEYIEINFIVTPEGVSFADL